MKTGLKRGGWQRAKVTNLVSDKDTGIYYARARINGKLKWRSLKTQVESVAKQRLNDTLTELRAAAQVKAASSQMTGTAQTNVEHFIAIYRESSIHDASLAPATKLRREIALKAVLKTWPDLPTRDARRVTPSDCEQWAASALRTGTGFVAPKAKTVRKGMAASSFNKCVDTLRAIFEIARKHGVAYGNPADSIKKAKMKQRKLELPSVEKFRAIVESVASAGARQSQDCADLVRLIAFSGARLSEATELQWRHVDTVKAQITIPGTKTDSSHRTIPLFPPLGALLDDIRSRRGEVSPDAPIAAVHECKGALRSACRTVGVKTLTHHDLRHLFATRCIEIGTDIPTVANWLGHRDGGALLMRTYSHLRNEHSQAAALKISF